MKKPSSTVNGPGSTTKSKAELIAKRMAVASCSRCVFLHAGEQAGYIGECHRSAPPAGLIRFAHESGGVSPAHFATWPMVKSTDACGEFLRRPVNPR
jgi:hypothetical protein